jgi:RsiW-degrading membrane proteinase PrsW (M82 family)
MKTKSGPRVAIALCALVLVVVTTIVPFASLVALAILFVMRHRFGRRELQLLAGAAIVGFVLQFTWVAVLYFVPLQGSTVFH